MWIAHRSFSNFKGFFPMVQRYAIIWFLIFNCGPLTRVLLLLFSRSSFYDIACFSILASGPRFDVPITSLVPLAPPVATLLTIHNQLLLNHVFNQAGFANPVINGRDFIYFGILKMVFTLGKTERVIFDHKCIILGIVYRNTWLGNTILMFVI